MSSKSRQPYKFFSVISSSKRGRSYDTLKCDYCDYKLVRKSTRCVNHTNACDRTPSNLKARYGFTSVSVSATAVPVSDECVDSNVPEPALAVSVSLPKKRKTSIDDYLIKRNYNSEEMKQLFTMALVTGSVPFRFADNPYLRRFAAELGVTNSLPTAKQVRKTELNKCAENCELKNTSRVKKTSFVSISADGSRFNNKWVFNFVTLIPEPIFETSIVTNEISASAIFYSENRSV